MPSVRNDSVTKLEQGREPCQKRKFTTIGILRYTMRPDIEAGVQAHSSRLFRGRPQTHNPDDIAGNEGGALAEQESQS